MSLFERKRKKKGRLKELALLLKVVEIAFFFYLTILGLASELFYLWNS